ncbi:hypothetical protein LTR92_010808 [Exophiala xenobiotica]|nr:hypothetical protein LTR92_010808 [Exophiala xenobiotica]KAK5469986.1 hypothetical protein LTR55_011246 [Exophiala xenobiotica]
MRDLERDIVPMCRDEGMSICPYSVLNTGTLQSAAAFEERKKNNTGRQFPVTARDKDMSRVLEAIADTKKTTLTNVALAYVMHKEPYVYPIVGGGKISHIKGSIEGISTSLSAEEMDQIDKAYDFDPGFPYTFAFRMLTSRLSPILKLGIIIPIRLLGKGSEAALIGHVTEYRRRLGRAWESVARATA